MDFNSLVIVIVYPGEKEDHDSTLPCIIFLNVTLSHNPCNPRSKLLTVNLRIL